MATRQTMQVALTASTLLLPAPLPPSCSQLLLPACLLAAALLRLRRVPGPRRLLLSRRGLPRRLQLPPLTVLGGGELCAAHLREGRPQVPAGLRRVPK